MHMLVSTRIVEAYKKEPRLFRVTHASTYSQEGATFKPMGTPRLTHYGMQKRVSEFIRFNQPMTKNVQKRC